MMDVTPQIVQVVPHDDYTVSVYFCDGRIVKYDVKPMLDKGVFSKLKDKSVFMERCTILNDTLAWDIEGNRDRYKCLDIDPDYLYSLESIREKDMDY